MILLDGDGKTSKPQVDKKTNYFKSSEETTLGKAGRLGYKAVSEGLSSLAGLPASMWNLLAPVAEKISELSSGPTLLDKVLPGMDSPGSTTLPRAPEFLTSEGLKENVFNPIGEQIFGQGSMRKQDGILEDIITRGSQIAPLALLGGASIPGALSQAGLSATGGAVAKQLGAGEMGQSIAELGAGIVSPLAYKAAISRSVPKVAKQAERSLWSQVEKQAAKETNVPIMRLYDEAEEVLSKASRVLPGKEKKVVLDTLASVSKSWGPKEASAQNLIDSTRKIFNTIPQVKSAQGKKILNDFRVTINKGLDNIIESYPEARSITKAIKQHPYLTNIAKKSSPTTNRLLEGAMAFGKFAAIPAAVKFGGSWSLLGALGATGAYAVKNMAQDYKLLKASPTLRRMFTGFMKDISAGSISTAATKANSIAKYIDKDKYKENFKPTMQLVD